MSLPGTHAVHILLPMVQIVALALPPFENRAWMFVPLIGTLACASASNLGSYSAELRAALISQWPWYLGTIAHLMLAKPEHEYWRLDKPEHEAEKMSFGPQKLAWSAALWVNPRGINWSQQIRGIRRGSAPTTRWRFVFHQLQSYLLYYLIVDVMMVYTLRHFYHLGVDVATVTVRADSWARSCYNSWHMLLQVIAQLQFQYLVCSMTTVALGIYEPKDWPPWLGSFHDLTSVRLLWNAWEHQIIRRVFMAYSKAFVSILGLTRGSNIDHYSRVYVSFFISGIFHGITNYVMPAATGQSMWDPAYLQVVFYILQAMAIQAEDVVASVFRKLGRWMGETDNPKLQAQTQDSLGSHANLSGSKWKKVTGYLWVFCWVWFSMGWAGDGMLRSGVARLTPLPVSIVEPCMRKGEQNIWLRENVMPWVHIYLGDVPE